MSHYMLERNDPELRIRELENILGEIVADFDRRRSTIWGRFLLWLLRKTT